jgi:hypothetical protein
VTDTDGPTRPAPRRTPWEVFSFVLGRLAFGGLCLMFIVCAIGALRVAYQDLAGPYCDRHRMGPADTCSVLSAYLSRGGWHNVEKLNPGTEPAVLTPPAGWSRYEATPVKTIQGVYSPAGMRVFHRTLGYEMLGAVALFALIPASWGYGIARAARTRRSSTTTPAGKSHSRTGTAAHS